MKIGQVVSMGPQRSRYVVVGINEEGVELMALSGIFGSEIQETTVTVVRDDECHLENKAAWAKACQNRWAFIARTYPAING